MLAGRRRIVLQQPELAAFYAPGPETDAAALADRGQRRGAVAVAIHDGRSALRQEALEQPRLGREVVVHRGVVVEMLMRQVGEAGGGETDAVEAMLIETMARRLDRKVRDALARQGRQVRVKL